MTNSPTVNPDVNEQKFRMLIEAVQDYAIYMLDVEGNVMTWNAGAQRNKGYTGAEIIGKLPQLQIPQYTQIALSSTHMLDLYPGLPNARGFQFFISFPAPRCLATQTRLPRASTP